MDRESSYNLEYETKEPPYVQLKPELGTENGLAHQFIAYDSEGNNIGTIALTYQDKTAEIGYVNVKEDFRGKGYGVAIYEYAIDICKSMGLVLEASSDISEDALKVWEKLFKKGLAGIKDGRYYAK